MTTNAARLVLAVIASVAVTVWLAGWRYLANSPAIAARRERSAPGTSGEGSGADPGPTTIVGQGEIAGDRAALSARLAAKVARDGFGPGIPVEIVEGRDGLLEFISPGDPGNPRGRVVLESAGPGRTRYSYEVRYAAAGQFLRIGWIIQGVGLVMLAVIYGSLNVWVATSANPALRNQCFQLVQVGHLLWPPFMLGHRYRSQYRVVRGQMDTLLRNLPHTAG